MEYQDYDILLKYRLSEERLKSTYFGDPSIYEDGKILEIFPENGDKVTGKNPQFVFGTVVYLHYEDKFLILDQKKEDKIVETLVGLGGKVRPMLGTVVQSNEKNDINNILTSYESGNLDTEEEIKYAAAREVMEETSTYKADQNGNYTHEIINSGLNINPKMLNTIGSSRIRITTLTKTECWMIMNFVYELSKEEYEYIENNVSKSNREGNLEWLTLDEALPHMSISDRIILKNYNKKINISEIRDNVNNQNVVRFEIEDDVNKHYGTLINEHLSYTSDDMCYELVSATKENTFKK